MSALVDFVQSLSYQRATKLNDVLLKFPIESVQKVLGSYIRLLQCEAKFTDDCNELAPILSKSKCDDTVDTAVAAEAMIDLSTSESSESTDVVVVEEEEEEEEKNDQKKNTSNRKRNRRCLDSDSSDSDSSSDDTHHKNQSEVKRVRFSPSLSTSSSSPLIPTRTKQYSSINICKRIKDILEENDQAYLKENIHKMHLYFKILTFMLYMKMYCHDNSSLDYSDFLKNVSYVGHCSQITARAVETNNVLFIVIKENTSLNVNPDINNHLSKDEIVRLAQLGSSLNVWSL